MKLFKFLAFFVMFIFSLFPTTVASIYTFGGKKVMIDFITQIPAGRFYLFGIPLFIITFGATITFMYLMLNIGNSPDKPKKALSIDDPNLEKKLVKLYN